MQISVSDQSRLWVLGRRLLAGFLCASGQWVFCAEPPRAPLAAISEEDAVVAKLTARLLEKNHYLQQNINDEVSRRLLSRYLDTLDYFHMLFTQEDIAEFDRYSTTLDDALNAGDLLPAFEIFTRLLERQQQRVDYVRILLARPETFRFDGDETFVADRHKLPRPANIEEARALWFARLKFDLLQEKLGEKKKDGVKEISGTVLRRYERTLRYLKETSAEETVADFLTSLAHVYDPHSDFLSRSELESFAINMQLSLFGIGAVLASDDGYCTIQKLIPGGPAERSKLLRAKDRIVKVGQGDEEPVDVVEMNLNKVVELIRGKKGTRVRLTIIPANADPGDRREILLVRDEIHLEDSRASAKVIDFPEAPQGAPRRLAVIDLPSFYSPMELDDNGGTGESTTQDVERLLRKLVSEGVEGVVLDLRRNGGGSLEEAINLAGLFIPEGPIVQVLDARQRPSQHADTDGEVAFAGPLVVLTSRLSASAAEIVAGALQDYGRAVVAGDSATHGKGTVQSLIKLGPLIHRMVVPFFGGQGAKEPGGGALKITVQKFYRASGSSTQLKGVQPDIVLPSINDFSEFGETALDNPLPWDEIGPAAYEPMHFVEGALPDLRRKSEQRVLAEPEFEYIRRDIQRRREFLERKAVSLNEEVRLREQAEIKAEIKKRDVDRAARRPVQDVVRLLAMTKVDAEGLPAPEPPRPPKSEPEIADPADAMGSADDPSDEEGPLMDPAIRESLRILSDLIVTQAAGQSRENIAATQTVPTPPAPR